MAERNLSETSVGLAQDEYRRLCLRAFENLPVVRVMKCANCGVAIAPTADDYTHIPGPGDFAALDCDNPSPTKAPPPVPDREHLKDREVRLTLNPWARPGPTAGVFAGQGEKGLTLIVTGGGRYTYSHHEVAEVTPA